MYPVYFFIVAVVASLIHIFLLKNKAESKVIEIITTYLVVFCIGFQGLYAFIGHAFFADEVARGIGWPTGSPFQFEIAITNLSIGIAALLSIFWKKKYWICLFIIYAVFMFGAAYGHFVQYYKGDTSPYNWGIFLFVGDMFIPALILLIASMYFVTLPKKTLPKKAKK